MSCHQPIEPLVQQVAKTNATLLNDQTFKQDIYPQRKPHVITGYNLGPCMQKWNGHYLADIGGQEMVKLHVSTHDKMDFITKNFSYK